MKKIYLSTITLFFCAVLNAQIDVKINPIGLLFGSPDLAGEYRVNDDFGAELTLSAEMGTAGVVTTDDFNPKKSGFGAMLAGKYYFSPENGCDKFYAGLYLRERSYKVEEDNPDYLYGYKRTSFSGGLLIGYKWVSRKNVIFEIGTGFGRAFTDKIEWTDEDGSDVLDTSIRIDVIGRLSLGYRF